MHHLEVIEQATRAIEDGEPYRTEFRLRTADGGYRWFLARGQCQYDASGRAITSPPKIGIVSAVTTAPKLKIAPRQP